MQQGKSLALLGLFGAMFATHVSAHGLWTEQRRGNIEAIYGDGAEDNAFKAQKNQRRLGLRHRRKKMIPVTVERLADHARLQPLKPPAALAVALDNGMWSLTADKKSGSTKDAVRCQDRSSRPRRSNTAWPFTSRGAKLPKLDQMKLVILPEVDPLTVGPGKSLPVRVLLDGKPAAGVKLVGDYRSAPSTMSTETDADGRAQVLVRNEGLNVIAAQVEVPVKKIARM
ncbi:DUF4198 domain-containing protein [Pseudomonas lini]